MKFIGKQIKEKGIVLIALIIIVLISIAIIAFIVKSIFDAKSIGATNENNITTETAIGKYIEYTPNESKYQKVTNNSTYTGTDTNQNDFITDTELKWRIWDINEKTLTIISDKPVSVGGYRNLGGLNLANCNGYNNGVKLLNDICLECYSNNEYGAVARSINVEDIEKTLDIAVWRPERYTAKGSEAKTYSGRKEYTANICYPYIYGEEEKSSIDNIEKQEGIGRSSQDILYEGKQSYAKAKEKINPMQTAWSNSKISKKNFKNQNHYYMIFKEGYSDIETLMSYFLATRSMDLLENHVNFGIFEVSMGDNIKTNTLFNSRGASLEYWDRIRPIVEIPRENIKIENQNDGMTKENAWKIIENN